MPVFAGRQMTILGITLIVIGLALVCGGLIFWRRASRTEEEEEGRRASKAGSEAAPEMADLLRRLNEIPDDDPFR